MGRKSLRSSFQNEWEETVIPSHPSFPASKFLSETAAYRCQHPNFLRRNLTLAACRIEHVFCDVRKRDKENVIRHSARACRIARIHLGAVVKNVAPLIRSLVCLVAQADGVHAQRR